MYRLFCYLFTCPDDKSIIGNYRLEKTIGEGTFGKVKLGIHIPTEERVKFIFNIKFNFTYNFYKFLNLSV